MFIKTRRRGATCIITPYGVSKLPPRLIRYVRGSWTASARPFLDWGRPFLEWGSGVAFPSPRCGGPRYPWAPPYGCGEGQTWRPPGTPYALVARRPCGWWWSTSGHLLARWRSRSRSEPENPGRRAGRTRPPPGPPGGSRRIRANPGYSRLIQPKVYRKLGPRRWVKR